MTNSSVPNANVDTNNSSNQTGVIVDEVQDCSPEDIKLLDFLRSRNISLVMAGDLDQSIYGFRGNSIEAIRRLTNKVTAGTRLNGNFRSSPTICSVVDNLRSNSGSDVACGPNAEVEVPIYLMHLDGVSDIPSRIHRCASSNGIAQQDVIMLAFEKRLARETAGHAAEPFKKSSSKLVKLAQSAAVIQNPYAATKNRSGSQSVFHRLILSLADDRLHRLPENEFFSTIGLRERQFRDGCLRLAILKPPYSSSASEYCAAIKAGVNGLGWTWINGGSLRTPKESKWQATFQGSNNPLRHANIHAFKGLQVPAVALGIPEATWGR